MTSESWEDASFLKMRQLNSLYEKFADLARDIRDHRAQSERVYSFEARTETFFQKLREYGPAQCTSKLPYLHILREHIGKQMVLWYDLLGWGYGYFSCCSSEHLNKLI
ncbi:hypothetical protein AC249_AIPGENE23931 [Exaiptasia diaphana]|nr:hypothetical protein AC249_AIPGENE23931 [Exaiptasia diaphana]